MYRIQLLDKISKKGLEAFSMDKYEIASEIPNPDGVLVRSSSMHDMTLPVSLKTIGRAGTGVNNIPVEECTRRGIAVFNTPGGNANSVKELVLAGLILCSRQLIEGIEWTKTLKDRGDEIPALVEKNKMKFCGPEIRGKTLGVIGLGAVGVTVANDALALGMHVSGLDPFISVESAWGLSREVRRVMGLETLVSESDYITIHAPLTDTTKGMINEEKFRLMKRGVRLLNFARGGLVNNSDLIEAIKSGIVSYYVTDFPDAELIGMENVTAIPHLGASSPEAEENCASMAANQISDYLEKGIVRNSVNFPDCSMVPNEQNRLVIVNRNVPKMVSQITFLLAEDGFNIAEMINRHKGDIAYNIIDVDEPCQETSLQKIRAIKGVITARALK